MSIEATAWAMELEAPSARTKFLLIMLADQADIEGRCVVTMDRLSRITQMNASDLEHGISLLERAQLIRRGVAEDRLPLEDFLPADAEVIRLSFGESP